MKHADVIAKLSLREKCALLSGATVFETHALPNKGVPAIWLSDGPNGLRKQAGPADHLGLNPSEPATCFPTAATVANSWDPALGEEIGKALGEETASYSVNVILGPGLNTKRSPLCGRDFEYFSEDPYLSGKLAAGYVRGIQSVGVSACPKHFAANNQELRRMASNSVLDERTLRELYLTGFEIAVKEGRPKCIMTSYNRVNGTYANENHHLLQDILHGEWGYDGGRGHRLGRLQRPCGGCARRLHAGNALPRLWLGQAADAGRGGGPSAGIRGGCPGGRAAGAGVHHRCGSQGRTEAVRPGRPSCAGRRAAAESVVLLKNEDDLLPLKPGQRVALIGDFAQTPRYQGAGSSSVNATRVDNLKDAAEADDITLAGFCAGYERSGTPQPGLCGRGRRTGPQGRRGGALHGSGRVQRERRPGPQPHLHPGEPEAAAGSCGAGQREPRGGAERRQRGGNGLGRPLQGSAARLSERAGRCRCHHGCAHRPGEPQRQAGRDSAPDLRGHPRRPGISRANSRTWSTARACGHRLPLLRNGPCAGALSLRLRPELHHLCLTPT